MRTQTRAVMSSLYLYSMSLLALHGLLSGEILPVLLLLVLFSLLPEPDEHDHFQKDLIEVAAR